MVIVAKQLKAIWDFKLNWTLEISDNIFDDKEVNTVFNFFKYLLRAILCFLSFKVTLKQK